MKKNNWFLLIIFFIISSTLIACREDDEIKAKLRKEVQAETTPVTAKADEALFDVTVMNKGKPIKGGTLQVGMVKDEPFQGIFLAELYEDGYDADLMSFASNSIFEVDGNFLINDEGIASMKVDQKNDMVTITIREGVKWSDGEPLKIEDLMLPYEIIAHPDYDGVRYDTAFQNIIGVTEYHEGKEDSIKGVQKIDDRTMHIYFKQLSPAIFSGGDGLWTYAAPSHQLKDIPVAKLIESDAVRKNPVTLGAFKFDKIVPGESVQFVKNKHYWKGEPKLDGVLVKVVPSSSVSVAIGSGAYDVILGFNATKMPEIEKLDNISILGRPELFYSYLGFKLGKYDKTNEAVMTDLDNSKMGNQALRQAMGYALDIEQVSEVYYYDLRERANSLIPPVFTSFYDKTLKGYTYDPEKAKALLDEAGYKDVDDDGYREDPNGEKLEIKFAAMAGESVQQDIVTYFIQNWKDVGLNVTLTTGRLIEFNSFYDKIAADAPDIDIFMGGWGTGTNPSPAGLYGKADPYNFSRYTSEELETIIQNIDSRQAFDKEYRANQFRAFQEYMLEVAPVIPMQFRYEIVPVNNRVKNYSIDYNHPTQLHEIELLAETPIKDS